MNKLHLIILFVVLLILLFLNNNNHNIELFTKNNSNIELLIIKGPNIYTKKKVILIKLDQNINNLEQFIDEIIFNNNYINYVNTFIKIINKNNKLQIIIDYDDKLIAKKIIEYSYNKIYNNIIGNIEEIKKDYNNRKLGPSTKAIIDIAKKKFIPYFRMNHNSLIQLGWGIKQKRIEASTSSNTFAISEMIVKNKNLTKKMLKSINIPISEGYLIKNKNELIKYFNILKNKYKSFVIKPLDGNHGNGVSLNIKSESDLINAYELSIKYSDEVIIENYIEGNDYRVLIINNKFAAAAKRIPAFVMGNNKNTIKELIDFINRDPKRGDGHNSALTKIVINDNIINYLNKNNMTLETVPKINEQVYISDIANLSQGGTAEDVSDIINPTIINQCIDAAYQCDLDICGIDIICKDITIPLEQQNGAIIELNSGPGLRMHISPSKGNSRNVQNMIIDSLFPKDNGRIPIISITGVNGKTTVVNLVSFILSYKYKVGKTTTNGIYINNKLIETGDCSGPKSAKKVLKNIETEIAVLETARGGILKGLAYDYSDVAVITNIGNGDHIGEHFDNMNILDIIEIKTVIIRNINPNGYAVLNANDIYINNILEYTNPNTKIIFFSIKKNNIIIEHIRNNNKTIYYENNTIIYYNNNEIYTFDINDIPFLEIRIDFIIENIMAAIAACIAIDIPLEVIKIQLSKFINDENNNPGRFNILNYNKSKLILDYAHNVDSINGVCQYFNGINSKKIVMYGPAGDREDNVITDIINKLYDSFDTVILFIDVKLIRGRDKNDFIKFIKSHEQKNCRFVETEKEAIDIILGSCNETTALLLLDDVKNSIEYIKNKIYSI